MSEQKTIQENSMRGIKVAKLTLNIGAGTDQKLLETGVKLLEHITGIPPVKTYAKKRVPSWGVRPGLPIGCKLTLRGKKAEKLIGDLLDARDRKIGISSFDNHGNISFGLTEYIDITDVKYNPEIGMMGLQACITLERPGFRIKKRKICKTKIPKTHQITQDDAIQFMKEKYKLEVL